MPIGPRGEKRPGHPVGCAVTIMKIATGEIEEEFINFPNVTGGEARASSMTAEERSELARKAANARWSKRKKNNPES